MKYIFIAILSGMIASPALADCYTQRWSNASSTSCDDGSTIDTHGDTATYTDPDGNQTTTERYGDRFYTHDDKSGDDTVCAQIGSIWSCR